MAGRISPETVAELYKKHGIKPRIGVYYSNGCACGIGICALDAGILIPEPDHTFYEITTSEGDDKDGFIAKKLGISIDYLHGYVDGFDGYGRYAGPCDEDEYNKGHEDGKASWLRSTGSNAVPAES